MTVGALRERAFQARPDMFRGKMLLPQLPLPQAILAVMFVIAVACC